MRLFLAVHFDEGTKKTLDSIQNGLKRNGITGNFTRVENLHLTLVFLGETPHSRLSDVRKAMDRVNETSFSLTLGGLGAFRSGGGEIWWIGVRENQDLLTVQRTLCKNLRDSDFITEEREYKPHLTLVRDVRLSGEGVHRPLSKLLTAEDTQFWNEYPGGIPVWVERISLMKSERIGGLLTYTEIAAKEL